ncbi:MAG: hypothetical protein EOR00_22240 [Mesorhizobium sp.]|uniref:hypothetical protein n=1 Tax=Mesorhizobium sp. TaxID=1871066 RepID=UPI000FE5F592|nr:hypothetical protein [Mesorhizobium sp.]RWP14931.1 MAG: hypothetical protein EOR00_22240 [Mesorhizobium sp.]
MQAYSEAKGRPMFAQKTLLILGAGASKEAELPTGDDLKGCISRTLQVESHNDFNRTKSIANETISDALRFASRSMSNNKMAMKLYTIAAEHISRAIPLARSIDEFLNSHNGSKETELCGKLAIVHEILIAERHSLMFLPDRLVKFDFNKLAQTWYNKIAALIFNCSLENLPAKLDALTVIIFNYDRCFEHFMYHAIMDYYRISGTEAAKLVKSIKIYHPYGTVGALPWMDNTPSCAFGADVSGEVLLEFSKGIKTFTEGVDPDSSEIVAIREAVRSATTVVFLGFGFIPLNMELLRPGKFSPDGNARKVYYATAKGLSRRDTALVERELEEFCPADSTEVNISNELYCKGIFTEYARSLALG